ncbi:MAG: hypothetical protein LBB67_00020 [Oscillospiraceae bacterium]|jgi:triacylglycerol lipase|nr:hypothetical protein [Oscillospiraceae bacterium]
MLQSVFAFFLVLAQMMFTQIGIGVPIIRPENPKNTYPIVFVHGLGGWGQSAGLNGVYPHWELQEYLREQGYETYAASVGPISSAWDRACELYAELTGTTVDYGEAHAKAHNHARFGETYKKLLPNWSKNQKIHLIGHSFGGATIRLFVQLLNEGSAEERKTTGKENLSPLFSGDLDGLVSSVATLGAPHNGMTATDLPEMQSLLGVVAGISAAVPVVEYLYPSRLRHFGVSTKVCYLDSPIAMVRNWDAFMQGTDNAGIDLSVDGAYDVNRMIQCQPDIFYFSFAAQITQDDGAGNQVLNEYGKSSVFARSAVSIGKKVEPYKTARGVLIDDSWLPNDGLVNVISAQYPFGEPHKNYDANKLERGTWQVMPTIKTFDHEAFSGSLATNDDPQKVYDTLVGIYTKIEKQR